MKLPSLKCQDLPQGATWWLLRGERFYGNKLLLTFSSPLLLILSNTNISMTNQQTNTTFVMSQKLKQLEEQALAELCQAQLKLEPGLFCFGIKR